MIGSSSPIIVVMRRAIKSWNGSGSAYVAGLPSVNLVCCNLLQGLGKPSASDCTTAGVADLFKAVYLSTVSRIYKAAMVPVASHQTNLRTLRNCQGVTHASIGFISPLMKITKRQRRSSCSLSMKLKALVLNNIYITSLCLYLTLDFALLYHDNNRTVDSPKPLYIYL